MVITAVSIIIGTTIVMKSITHASMSASELYSSQAWATANGCAEYALGQFSLASTSFSSLPAPTTLSVGSTNCQLLPIIASGSSKVIKASSTVSSFVRRLQVTVATNTPQSVISSWQEVGDFTL